MRRHILTFVVLLIAIAASSDTVSAQSRAASPDDSLFRRARRMVAEGNGSGGRTLVDTLLRRAAEGTAPYGDALFWRGALAETAADAERDYRRVIVEYPLSFYADDALLALAELEQARGDRAGALQHLQRFVREHPASPARGTAALAAARLAFDQRDTRLGCVMLSEARASITTADVELRNQLEYFANRCPTDPAPVPVLPAPTTPVPVSSAPPASAPPQRVRDTMKVRPPTTVPVREAPVVTTPRSIEKTPAVRPAAAKPSPAPPAEKPARSAAPQRAGNYTIQLAAYNTKADAERLVAKLAARDVRARVSGTAKPFRVRLGFYATRQEAAVEVVALKARDIIGFVTTEAPAAAPAPERDTP